MTMLSRFLPILAFAALLLRFPDESLSAATEGLQFCATLIIPALFPFLVLSALCIQSGVAAYLGRLLSPLMLPLFGLRPVASTVLVLGMLGGYPVGARLTGSLYEEGVIDREEAIQLARFSNNCGPAFLISVAGFGIFGSASAASLLFVTHMLAAMLVGLLFRRRRNAQGPLEQKDNPGRPLMEIFPDCVRDSFMAVLQICAFVIFFTVLLRLLASSGVLPTLAEALTRVIPLPRAFFSALLGGSLELTAGVYALAPLIEKPYALPLCAFLIAWGGLSVHCQSFVFLRSAIGSLGTYFTGKLLHGLIAAALCAICVPFLPEAVEAIPDSPVMAMPGSALSVMQEGLLALFVIAGIFALFPKKHEKMPPKQW